MGDAALASGARILSFDNMEPRSEAAVGRLAVEVAMERGDVVLLLLSCVVGTVISWAGLNAQMYISATTMLVVTNLNKFVVIAFGILFLGESRTWQAVLGCCAALGGGVWYAVARKNLAAKRAEAAGDAEAGKK